MTDTFYKALRSDMSSFADPDFRWTLGKWTRPKWTGERVMCNPGYLHGGTTPEAAVAYNASWPWRLFVIEGKVAATHEDDKVGFRQARLTEELPPWLPWGPNGERVHRLFVRLGEATDTEVARFVAAGQDGQDVWDILAAGDVWHVEATWYTRAVRAAEGVWAARATRYARDTWDAWAAWRWTVQTVATQHLGYNADYTREHFETLVAPWVEVFGRTWEASE